MDVAAGVNCLLENRMDPSETTVAKLEIGIIGAISLTDEQTDRKTFPRLLAGLPRHT
jgi:hypothetical protein